MRLPALVGLIAACSFPTKSPGVSDGRMIDGAGGDGRMIDAAKDGPLPPCITISGTVTTLGLGGPGSAVAGTQITLFDSVNDANLGSTNADGSGNYSLSIATNGAPVNVYLEAFGSAFMETFAWPPGPLSADDTGVPVEMTTASTLASLANACGASQDASHGTLIVEAIDDNAPISGAKVTSSPLAGSSCADPFLEGVTALFDVPAGLVTVEASGSGTFVQHTVNALAGTLTLTEISEE